jgi:hypothetical protein
MRGRSHVGECQLMKGVYSKLDPDIERGESGLIVNQVGRSSAVVSVPIYMHCWL